jgi:TIGR00730 family protein
MKNICVFCGSSVGTDKRYAEAAARLGDVLADNKCTLIYGGGSVGLMNVIANRMLERGCEVIGVMPDFLLDHEIGHPTITKMIPTKTMAERKEILIRESDAFISMPGGFGTLDEFSEVVVADQLRLIEKPIALYNTLGYYDDLVRWIDRGVRDGFIRGDHYKNVIVTDDPKELFTKMRDYNPVKMEKWIHDIKLENK